MGPPLQIVASRRSARRLSKGIASMTFWVRLESICCSSFPDRPNQRESFSKLHLLQTSTIDMKGRKHG